MKALLAETDYNIDVDAMNEIFVKWEKDKHENIATYRDQTFRSVVTGTMSPAHHTSWFKNMDDSKQGFLSSAI